MADSQPFPHLHFARRITGAAKLSGGGEKNELTESNRTNRQHHSESLCGSASESISAWKGQQDKRAQHGLPAVAGIPLLLQVDPSLDLGEITQHLGFEIVSEQEDGFVIVASAEMDLALFMRKVRDFASAVRGSAVVASVHQIIPETTQSRLRRICPWLLEIWAGIIEDQDYIVDAGIESAGTEKIPAMPSMPTRRVDETEEDWTRRWKSKLDVWETRRSEVYAQLDKTRLQRENEVERFIKNYTGETLDIYETAELSDSFTVRMRISGRGLKDFVQNYPFLFELTEPDDIELPQREAERSIKERETVDFSPPDEDAPAVGIIDSGIQTGHRWLSLAIDPMSSISLLPHDPSLADHVAPSGHGTRVGGAVLFGESVPQAGRHKHICWIQSARVLDAACSMPQNLLPALATRAAVQQLHGGIRQTRLFNQSINALAPSRLVHMSAWAAEIDKLSHEHDVLMIQSAGNIPHHGNPPRIGIQQHLAAGRAYPDYLDEPSSRIANPAQSLQALTVGSVGYDTFSDSGWSSFVGERAEPSSFSRSGLGIWDVIKPEVAEFGGDYVYTTGGSTQVGTPAIASKCFPELVRSTLHGGPAMDRDGAGTSFAAPKVTHIAVHLARILPDEPTLLYRALIVNSARWPTWALELLERYRREKEVNQRRQRNARKRAKKASASPPNVDTTLEATLASRVGALIRRIGFGIPDLSRASGNSAHRVTLITGGLQHLRVGQCDILQVPIPNSVRAAGHNHDVLLDVTLSYSAAPRRTRRTPKRYLSVWLDWITNRRGESLAAFETRAIKSNDTTSQTRRTDDSIPWTLHAQAGHGLIRGVARGNGTVQKDWAIIKLHQLPEVFCIAVRCHKGWSDDPKEAARYALAVSFEVLNQEVEIYDDIRIALHEVVTEEVVVDG